MMMSYGSKMSSALAEVRRVSYRSMSHFGVDGVQAIAGGVQLGPADVGGAVQHLALQVAEIDDVEIDQADAADAGGGQVQPQRRAEPAGADEQHAERP